MSIGLIFFVIVRLAAALSMTMYISYYWYIISRNEKAHVVFDVVRWPGLVGAYIVVLAPPNTPFTFTLGVLVCVAWTYIVRTHKCDNDRWKKLKDKVGGVVREIQGRLVVVPADLVPVPA